MNPETTRPVWELGVGLLGVYGVIFAWRIVKRFTQGGFH